VPPERFPRRSGRLTAHAGGNPQADVRIKHLATNEEVTCTVADINPGTTDVPEVGTAFAKPSPSFWRVSLPPEDWSPRSLEAKRGSSITNSNAGKPVMVKK
jgi:hypothetical protein